MNNRFPLLVGLSCNIHASTCSNKDGDSALKGKFTFGDFRYYCTVAYVFDWFGQISCEMKNILDIEACTAIVCFQRLYI